MQKPDNIPKNVTLKVLRETGKVPKVKDFVQALNAGRQRSASTGSINNKVNMTDDIYEAVDGEEYNDAISQDWPATDSGTDSEAIYEYIAEPDAEGQFDNKIQLSKDGQLRYRVPTRRYGQKRKGVNRPTLSVEEDEGILPDHSSSGFTTEGSSKEGTMESVDDRAGIDADIENDSDSSNSGIYEPINPDFTHVRDDDGDTGNDTPPELPAERIKKKKKDKDGKSAGQKFGSKLKQFYKSKITSNQEPTGIHKVSSAPVVNTTGTTTSSSSAGVFNKIGGKLKLIKRTKSAEPSTLLEEEVVISSSDYEGSDTNENPGLEESEPIMMKPTFADIEYADSSSSCELISNEGTDPQQPAYANDSAKNGELDAPPVPPPLPPRISGNFSSQPDGRTSPPLPPRNRISQNVNLDTVVPISPGLNNDSDLYGQLDRRYTTKFESEPLYQIYNKDKITRDSHIHTVQTHSDDESGDERIYEAVDEMFEKVKAGLEVDSKTDNISPSKTVSTLELFGKTGSVLRALWSEMPEVKESGILENISPQERKIQEAMFEIITSEASYLKSVNVLIDVFLMSPEFSSEHSDRCVISRQERHVLFSNIGAVRESSEQFLMDLEGRWQQSVQLSDVCDIIYRHAAKKFDCYVRYCSNQTFQDRATQELMKKQEFAEAVRRLERTPECQGLPMISFLLLPMQRITRLPLLVDAICHRLEPGTDRHKSATRALDALNRVVKKCNDGAKKMQQTEQMCHLVQNLEFKVKEIPLISASRYLVKQGELTRIATDTSSKLPFGRGKPGKHSVHVYLFNDLILFSKKKSSNQYVVTDYGPRNALHVEVIDTAESKAKLLPQGVPSGCKNIFLVAMLENHEQKQVEMVLSCKSPSERARWIDALTPVTKHNDNEKIYEEWDCPQVHCIKKYIAAEPDELTLEESDVINVFKKMADGSGPG
ncbi:hypothetical protein KUTeg_001631 [Tegillarca granosa]|uniref:Uncharacterized protein n=1 Tax=Tegillarca granosa TaxID=220873 RepID=A0ABQ9FRZ8_TEGGR|nr:hypothetical protein KUTeg_001631 [Tegillarca granosa]